MSLIFDEDICDNLFDGLYRVDTDRRIVFWNQAAAKMTGFAKKEVVGKRCQDNLLQHVDDHGEALCQGQCPLAKSLADGQYRENLVYLHHKQGHRVPVEIRIVPLRDEAGLVTGAAEIFKQVSPGLGDCDGKMRELARMAFVDGLTGLSNRQYIELKLRERLSASRLSANGDFGVIKLEIGNLKEINDDYGEDIGNLALRVSGQTLLANIETGDTLGRWYGGRFIVLTSANRKSTLLNWATKLKVLLEQSTIPDYDEITLKVNVGGISQQGEDAPENVLYRLEGQLRKSRLAANNISIEE